MNGRSELHVHIGEVKVARNGESLHALLGSCVGVGFIYPESGVCGLAHCLLSRAPAATKEIGGRHVDQAIHSLMTLMEIGSENVRRVRVILAGGGNMTMAPDAAPTRLVGSANAEFAKKIVRECRLRLLHEELGGCNARKIVIDSSTNEFTIKSIPRLGEASCKTA